MSGNDSNSVTGPTRKGVHPNWSIAAECFALLEDDLLGPTELPNGYGRLAICAYEEKD
jgi:hypothetical protein